MGKKITILLFLLVTSLFLKSQDISKPDFRWGNCYYYNMNAGDCITFNSVEVELLQVKNHYNLVKVGEDTLWLKVARRSTPDELHGVRIFIADNKNLKKITSDTLVHGLLSRDALICLGESDRPMLENESYIFPVSFNDGFLWTAEEDTYIFSWLGKKEDRYPSYPGIGIDLHDARGIQKHWIVAIEDSKVVWITESGSDKDCRGACILLESLSQPGIYYVYNYLYIRNLKVKAGQNVVRGELLGTIWGDDVWGHLQFTVIKSDTIPDINSCFFNVINGFPQFYSLYFGQASGYVRNFSRGRIKFGKAPQVNGNKKNILAFEDYTGKGWKTGRWNTADKVEWVAKGDEGNARLKKILFEGTPAQCKNPDNYYDYEIKVRNGVYRIRAKVGDVFLSSWQKIEFEGVTAMTKSLGPGEFDWTTERIVKVEDGRLTIRVYVDEENKYVAGLSEIVFQMAY